MRIRNCLLTFLLALGQSSLVLADEPADALFARTFPNLQGQAKSLSSLRGQPLIVNFWATWCQPCREEMPELNKTARQEAGKVQVIGIALEDEAPAVRQFARQYKIDYPVFLAGTDAIGPMRMLGNDKGALPFTVVINRSGHVVDRHLGRLTAQRLRELVQRARD